MLWRLIKLIWKYIFLLVCMKRENSQYFEGVLWKLAVAFLKVIFCAFVVLLTQIWLRKLWINMTYLWVCLRGKASNMYIYRVFTVESSWFMGDQCSWLNFLGNPCPWIYIPTNIYASIRLIFINEIELAPSEITSPRTRKMLAIPRKIDPHK